MSIYHRLAQHVFYYASLSLWQTTTIKIIPFSEREINAQHFLGTCKFETTLRFRSRLTFICDRRRTASNSFKITFQEIETMTFSRAVIFHISRKKTADKLFHFIHNFI